jgi:hypothetical protein
MAEPTPWQLTKVGQNVQVKTTFIPIFSHGTEPWPYAPHGIVVKSSGSDVPGYGVNIHQPGGN